MALDASMLVAVTAAEVGAVHKLRTNTRRVEAQLTLLDLLTTGPNALQLPSYRQQAKVVRKRLSKVRRAAGIVRDLDVQTEAITFDAPAKTAVTEGTPGDEIRHQAKQLRKHLQRQRDVEAEKLVSVLKRQELKLADSLREIEHIIKPALHATIPQALLIQRIEHWFAKETVALLALRKKDKKHDLQQTVASIDEETLHAIRKAGKLCRYMAESAPQGSRAQRIAQHFEAIQEAGGKWHDWLLLQQLSAGYHGKKAALTQRYANHAQAALADYHLRLAEQLPTVIEPTKP